MMKPISRCSAALVTLSALCFLSPGSGAAAPPGRGVGAAAGAPRTGDSNSDKPKTLRLRSFKRGVGGSLHFKPSEGGGRAMLTAVNLPAPRALAPAAQTYVVWAVGPAAGPLRLGQLAVDASGNGGLAFRPPVEMSSYGVIITAEAEATSQRPLGPVVLSSRAREAQPFFNTAKAGEAMAAGGRPLNDLRKLLRSRRNSKGFFGEVESALDNSGNGGRFMELTGDEAAPGAFGAARAATVSRQAFVRAFVGGLRQAPGGGANEFVLWAVEPAGRMIYMGSVPADAKGESDLYVRVSNVGSEDYELAVTAERQRLVSSPSDRRALRTRRAGDEPIVGPSGYSIPPKK